MPRTEEQFAEIRSSRKKQILEAALEVFAQDGFHRASIANIARKAGVSKGLMYNYFASKEDLLIKVMQFGVEGLIDSFNYVDEKVSSPDDLKIFIQGSLQVIQSESHFYKLYFTVLMQPDVNKIVMKEFSSVVGELLGRIAAYFESKGDAHPMEKATLLGALLDGIGIYYLSSPENFDLSVYENIIYDLFK